MAGMIKGYNGANGELIVVTQADPAAGSNYLPYTLPAGYIYQLIAANLRLQADGNTQNRYISLEIDPLGFTDPIQCVSQWPMGPANRLWYLSALVGVARDSQINQAGWSGLVWSLPDILLPAGSTLRPNIILALQVGDQLSKLSYQLKRWGV